MVIYQKWSEAKARRQRRGQTLVEYALIIAALAIVAVAVLSAVGGTTFNIYSTIINEQVARTQTGS